MANSHDVQRSSCWTCTAHLIDWLTETHWDYRSFVIRKT